MILRTTVFLCLWIPAIVSGADAWPEFRGPDGQGHATAQNLPIRWSETENVAWKTSIGGRGWSSPVIEGDEIWLTTAYESELSDEERAKRLEGNTGSQPLTVSGPVSLRVVGVRRSSGEILREVSVLRAESPEPIHELNSFASPTPILENGKLYAHFGANGTACVDTKTGDVLWRNTEITLKHENGAGSSPISWKDVIIFHCDGSDVQSIVALEKKTGTIAWQTDRSGKMHDHPQMKKAYGTPLVATVGGKPQVLSPAADWIYAYDPKSGDELWKLPYGGLGFSIVPRPSVASGRAFMCTSFMNSQLLAIDLEGADAPRIAWRYKRQVPKISSPLVVEDEIYFVSDKGVATCLDTKSGDRHWVERLGGNYCASPLYADGRIYFFNREGVATVIEPGAKFVKLAENELESGFMASAAAVGDALYVRTEKAMYRLARPEPKPATSGD